MIIIIVIIITTITIIILLTRRRAEMTSGGCDCQSGPQLSYATAQLFAAAGAGVVRRQILPLDVRQM